MDIREWLEEIWEYCQEHWVVCLAAAAVVLVLLCSAGLIRAAKRDDLDDSEYCGSTGELALEPETEPEPAAEKILQDKPVSSAPEPAAAARGVVENLLKNVEEASMASGQKVESIQLKIEKAQLTIRYAGAADQASQESLIEELDVKEDLSEKREPAAAVTAPPAEKKETVKEEITMPKKFGSENRNIARSGRVYTEEELLNQIMD